MVFREGIHRRIGKKRASIALVALFGVCIGLMVMWSRGLHDAPIHWDKLSISEMQAIVDEGIPPSTPKSQVVKWLNSHGLKVDHFDKDTLGESSRIESITFRGGSIRVIMCVFDKSEILRTAEVTQAIP